jgi:transcriptional regulator with XRE-family HTH domain
MARQRKTAARAHTIDEVIARRLREVRDDRHWTQQQLSDELTRLGKPMDRTTVAKVEKGSRQARADELVALAAALDCAVVDLLLPVENEPVALTPKLKVDGARAHEWAEGGAPLDAKNARHYARQRPVRRLVSWTFGGERAEER